MVSLSRRVFLEYFFLNSSLVLVPSSSSPIGILRASEGSSYTLLFRTKNSPLFGIKASLLVACVNQTYLDHIVYDFMVVHAVLVVLELLQTTHESLCLPLLPLAKAYVGLLAIRVGRSLHVSYRLLNSGLH
jgi:hypothetical protein